MTGCDTVLLMLHGLLDGELDAANTLQCETHLSGCASCAASFARMVGLRDALRAADLHYPVPAGLPARVRYALAESVDRRRWIDRLRERWETGPRWGGASALAALAACLILFLMVPRADDGLVDEVVASHVRSLQASHLLDVAAADQHVVKPWFSGQVAFSPQVPDLSPVGFMLAGGRLDYVNDRPVAAIVYRRRRHVINVFVWPGNGGISRPSSATAYDRDGYNLLSWRAHGLTYWAVSDLNLAELRQFQARMAADESLPR